MTSLMTNDFELLTRGFYLEGLLVEGEDVWFTDVVVGGVQHLASGKIVLPERMMIGGLLLNEDGCLLVAGPGGIAWVNPETGANGPLVEGLSGANEMRADLSGGMVFGSIDLDAVLRGKKPAPSSLYRLSPDREMTLLRDGLAFANGLSYSADGATLFFNESFAASRAFPVSEDGTLGDPSLLRSKPDCDGLALDAEGNVWITGFSSSFLLCLAPDGSEVRRLELPGNACTNVRFGGRDMRDLYVTVVDTGAAQLLAQGRPLEEKSSALYRTRSPVPGAPITRTRFHLP
jgi:sugar lactone lactonase YvrE